MILMPLQNKVKDSLQYLVGSSEIIENMNRMPALPIFSPIVMQFLQELSKRLMILGKEFSDVVTFGFWCRKASLFQMQQDYVNEEMRFGKGIAFHIAPSNVPINFAFSLVTGLLAGNCNIIRIPSKNFLQVEIIVKVINNILESEFPELKDYICLVRYSIDSGWTEEFSKLSDIRIVWGGDQTISEIRKAAMKPRAGEITFADRYSLAIIDTKAYLESNLFQELAEKFYNDTYFSDQNACTSPMIVIWLGEQMEEASQHFWYSLQRIVEKNYQITGAQAVGKLQAFYECAMRFPVSIVSEQGNWITRLKLEKIESSIADYKYHSGFFFEYVAHSLEEINPLCGQRCQTISYYGVSPEVFQMWLMQKAPQGVDRIVPIGSTMDFFLIWDGHDLIRELSRKILIN